MAQTTARHLRCVLPKFYSTALDVQLQNPPGFFVPSGWSCISTQAIRVSHLSVSRVNYPSLQGSANTVAAIRLCCNATKASIFSVDKRSCCLGSPLFCLALSWAAICAKLGTKSLYTLRNPETDFNSVLFVLVYVAYFVRRMKSELQSTGAYHVSPK